MQCFRLPHELDSTQFRVDHIVASNCNSGFAIVGVNRTSEEENDAAFTSAIVIYSRLEFVNMLQETCLNKFSHTQPLYPHKGSLCNSKPITMQSVVLRFSTGTLILVDLYTGKWVQFLKDKDAVDVTLGEGDVLTVLSKDGSIHSCTIQQCISHSQEDEEELVAMSMTTYPNHIHLNKVLDYITTTDSIALQPLTLKRLSQLWQLTRAEISMGNVSSPSLSSHSFHIHAPPQWVDSQHIHQHRTFAQHKRVGFLSMGAKDSEVASSKSYMLLGEDGNTTQTDVLQSYVFALNILFLVSLLQPFFESST
uniref:Uncharacterized protein n=1 Tax=Ditylenchus dipsaci TaxID=166011 RepID=A0A915CLE3_9BILA